MSRDGRIKIIRPLREAQLISAGVFDNLFLRHLGEICDIRIEPLVSWCDAIMGPSGRLHPFPEAARRFEKATRGGDYLCPGYELLPLSPMLLALRNLSRSNIRLAFIAHAPGAYVMEWTLLGPLMASGDLIIAPSNSGKRTIEFLNPALSPFVRVIHHPMLPLPPVPVEQPAAREKKVIASIGRIDEGKLIHRQIEAMAILRDGGREDLVMNIAGPLNDPVSQDRTQYARSLFAKVERLRLEDRVRLIGPLYGDEAKSRFLSSARAAVCLSATVEEAYPKSSIEALGAGTPVVATRWNGLLETVGDAGRLIPVAVEDGGHIDVKATDVAEAIASIVDDPPSRDACRVQAEKFGPGSILERYKTVLTQALASNPELDIGTVNWEECEAPAAPPEGLLAHNAFLRPFLWKELFAIHLQVAENARRAWSGEPLKDGTEETALYELLPASTRKAVGHFLAGVDCSPWLSSWGDDVAVPAMEESFADRIYGGFRSRSNRISKEMCLFLCGRSGRLDLMERGWAQLRKSGETSRGLDFLTVELHALKGDYEKAFEFFEASNRMGELWECGAVLLRQLARLCRLWKKPERALPWLREWLSLYPDSPESGPVWLDRAANAAAVGGSCCAEAREACLRARNLLGGLPVLSKLEEAIRLKELSILLGG